MERKKIIIIIVVSVLIISGGFLTYKIINNSRKVNYIAEINHTLEEIDLVMVDDGIKEAAGTYTDLVTSFIYKSDTHYVNHSSDTQYVNTGLYDDMFRMRDITSETSKLFKLLIINCGIPSDEYNYCTFEGKKSAYRINQTDDTTLIEVYQMGDSDLRYYKLEYKKNEYVRIYEGSKTEADTISSGVLYVYDINNGVKRYNISDNQISFYSPS